MVNAHEIFSRWRLTRFARRVGLLPDRKHKNSEGSATAEPKIKMEKIRQASRLALRKCRAIARPKNYHVGTGEACPKNRADFTRTYKKNSASRWACLPKNGQSPDIFGGGD
ncbi:MAG: hypothetical protein N3B10_14035 [Armatimonadetes bacterium]|nr:hypothetical protein [Armatimonadota bacterium]